MSSHTGERLQLTLFGESHGAAVGTVLCGLPAGEDIDTAALARFARRRAPGGDIATSPRNESDLAEILSGVYQGKATGAPLCAMIKNTDKRSNDYLATQDLARPSHADYTASVRYGGHSDPRGGGHFSARLTAPLVFAGGLAMQILERRGIYVRARLVSAGSARDTDLSFEPFPPDADAFNSVFSRIEQGGFPTLTEEGEERLRAEIESARMSLDSVGGVVECMIFGMPAGVGDPIYGGLENRFSRVIFGIPAVKGIEFGGGFACSAMRASQVNDEFFLQDGQVRTRTNYSGGIQGGISNGMPIVLRTAFKPTPSVHRSQNTVNLSTMQEQTLAIKGRHDPCVAVRAVPCVQAAAAFVALDSLLCAGKI